MGDISFTEEQQLSATAPLSRARGGITGWVIKAGLAKDEKSAGTVMLIIVGVCIALAILFFVFVGVNEQALTETERQRNEQTTPLPRR